jgi:hypothetical protein
MCGALASADEAPLDASKQASGSDLSIERRTWSTLRRPTVVISVMSMVLLLSAVSYVTLRGFKLQGRSIQSIQRTPAGNSVEATASEPNIKSASAPLNESDQSPAKDANLRSARPRPEGISKTEDENPTELWSRVRKGNTGAEVALAKLYLEGTVVEPSCEQAHLLLLAASRKQSKAADDLLAGAYAKQCP